MVSCSPPIALVSHVGGGVYEVKRGNLQKHKGLRSTSAIEKQWDLHS